MEGAGSLNGKGLKGKLPDRVELEIGFLTEKVEDRDLQRGKDGGGIMVPQVVEDEAGLFTEDRGGGLKQVDVRGNAPRRDKRRKLLENREEAQPFPKLLSLMGS